MMPKGKNSETLLGVAQAALSNRIPNKPHHGLKTVLGLYAI
jgi:hypothetical protein